MRRLPLAVLSAFALVLAACGESGGGAEAPAAQADAIAVVQATVKRAEIAEPIVGTGNIAPSMVTDIGPSVDGIIEEVLVKVGDRVAQGQPLFRTRDVDYRLNLQQLEGKVALARAENTAAQRALQRTATLNKQGNASQGRLDDIRGRADAAAAQLTIAEAQLAAAKQALADTVVAAPYDGVITRRDVDPGKFMATRMGGMMGGGSGGGGGVVQLMKIDVVAAIVQAPEPNLPRLSVGLPARVTVDGLDRTVDATVDVVNHRVDDRTRGVEVRLAIQNADYAIKPGLFARAEILPPPRSALTLERSAVLGAPGARFVFREREGKAQRADIETRDLDAERVEVTAGLAEGDVVLSGPNLRQLFDGAPVSYLTAAGEQRAAAAQ